MVDKELEELKKKKLKELQNKMQDEHKKAQQEAMEKRAEVMKKAMLRRVLTSEARQRLGRVRLAHPKLAKQAEMLILRAMRARGAEEKINDDELKQILKRLS